MARIVAAIGRWHSGELSCGEAAQVLGMSERHFRRLRDRYEADGAAGIVDRRLGKASALRVPVDRIDWVVETDRTRYAGFTVKHDHEHLVRDHGFTPSYTWLKAAPQARGAVGRAAKRPAHRRRTARGASGRRRRACCRSGTARRTSGCPISAPYSTSW